MASRIEPRTLTQPGAHTIVRKLAAGAASLAAVLYVVMGLATPIGISFGASLGLIFAAEAIVLLLVERRGIWVMLALLNLGVLVGYLVLAGIRQPAFDAWGLAIKACQLVALVAIGYLIVKGRPHPRTRSSEPVEAAPLASSDRSSVSWPPSRFVCHYVAISLITYGI